MVDLGVGKNMVQSIRFWVEMMGVADRLPDKTLQPTAFGQAIFSRNGFDPFLEDIRTLWLIHWNLATGVADELFAWDLLLNKWPYAELTRTEALAALKRESDRLGNSHSEVTLGQHLDIFLHTYVPSSGKRGSPEDSLDCPLADLELLQYAGTRRADNAGRQEPVYAIRRESKPEITKGLFEYCLNDNWQLFHQEETTMTYREVAIAPRSVGQVFKLPEDDVRSRLEFYSSNKPDLYFSYQPSAIQGLLTRHEDADLDFLAAVYTEDFQ